MLHPRFAGSGGSGSGSGGAALSSASVPVLSAGARPRGAVTSSSHQGSNGRPPHSGSGGGSLSRQSASLPRGHSRSSSGVVPLFRMMPRVVQPYRAAMARQTGIRAASAFGPAHANTSCVHQPTLVACMPGALPPEGRMPDAKSLPTRLGAGTAAGWHAAGGPAPAPGQRRRRAADGAARPPRHGSAPAWPAARHGAHWQRAPPTWCGVGTFEL